MTWNGSKITIAGFTAIFDGFNVSEPTKDEELGIYECSIGSTKLQAKTLIELARKAINRLASGES